MGAKGHSTALSPGACLLEEGLFGERSESGKTHQEGPSERVYSLHFFHCNTISTPRQMATLGLMALLGYHP